MNGRKRLFAGRSVTWIVLGLMQAGAARMAVAETHQTPAGQVHPLQTRPAQPATTLLGPTGSGAAVLGVGASAGAAPAISLRDDIVRGHNPLRSVSLGALHPLRVTQPQVQVAQRSAAPIEARPRPRVIQECPADTGNPSVAELTTSIALPAGDLPVDCRKQEESEIQRVRFEEHFEYAWEPSLLQHKPLYFEEVPVERYGHSRFPVLQPWVSGVHFFVNCAALPWKMLHDPPRTCIYELGYERPGNCVPHIKRRQLLIP